MELSDWLRAAPESDDPRLVWYALTWALDYQTMVQWCFVREFAGGGKTGAVVREVPLGAWLHMARAQVDAGQPIPADVSSVLTQALRANPGLALWSRLTPGREHDRMQVQFQLQRMDEGLPATATA